MKCTRFALAVTILAFTLFNSSFAGVQSRTKVPSPSTGRVDPVPDTTIATLPQQLRQAQPPAASASAADLERAGDDLRSEKAFADAVDYYAAAARKADSAALQNKIGISQLMLAHVDDAKKSFKRSIRLDPHFADAHNNLGVSEYWQKHYKQAIKHYKEALKVREDSASIHSNLGTAYFERKNMDKAAGEYTRALQLDPDVFEHTSHLGVSAHLASPQDRGRFHFVIARMYAQSGNSDRCLLYLTKAIEEGYKNVDAAYADGAFQKVRRDPRFDALMGNRITLQPR